MTHPQPAIAGKIGERQVAALFVQTNGAYFGLPDVDPWGEARDARLYAGPHPVVAHPPCGPWSSLKHMRIRLREEQAGCMSFAVAAVRKWGGVLEQPAGSLAFDFFKIPRPGEFTDKHGGWSVEVLQVEWGHPARKRTWLYIVGPASPLPAPPFPGRAPTHWVSGGRKRSGKGSGGLVPPGIKVCSARQRSATPPAFRDLLLRIARSASRIGEAG